MGRPATGGKQRNSGPGAARPPNPPPGGGGAPLRGGAAHARLFRTSELRSRRTCPSTMLRMVPLPRWGRNYRSAPSVMRQRPGHSRCGCERGAHGEAARGKSRSDIPQQSFLAAEQVGGAGDIDQQTVGRIERAPRPPALRPQGELLEASKIARRVGGDSGKIRAQRARVGEQHADARARGKACIIGRGDARAMGCLEDQRGGGGIGLRRGRAPPAIDRQSGEPDGQDPARHRRRARWRGAGFRRHR